MDDIVRMVKEKAGISDDAAQKAVNTVVGFIKGKLPGNLSSQIDGIVSGHGLGDTASGMFGGKK